MPVGSACTHTWPMVGCRGAWMLTPSGLPLCADVLRPQLVALHDLDPDGAAAMWQLSRDAEQEFPLAIVSLAMTRHARQVRWHARATAQR